MKPNLTMLWCLIAASWPSAALACGGLPIPSYTLVDFAPGDGAENVPRNEPLRFRFDCSEAVDPDVAALVCEGPRLTVEVTTEGSGVPLAGTVANFGPYMLFTPEEMLAANTTYTVKMAPGLHESVTPAETTFSFRTGAELHAAPEIVEPASAISQAYLGKAAICGDERLVGPAADEALILRPCFDNECVARDPVRIPQQRVASGTVTGDLSALGYELLYTVERPADGDDIVYSERRHARLDEPTYFRWDYPVPGLEDTWVCANLTARDAAGRELVLYTDCFDYLVRRTEVDGPFGDVAFLGGEGDDGGGGGEDGTDHAMGNGGLVPVKDSSGCSAGRAGSGTWLSVFGLVTLLVQRRKRKT